MNAHEAASLLRALGWRCEPPEAPAAPTLPAEPDRAVEPPQAPRKLGSRVERQALASMTRLHKAGLVSAARLAECQALLDAPEPPEAPRGVRAREWQVWQTASGGRRLAMVDGWHVAWSDGAGAGIWPFDDWHAWVRKTGARVVA